MKKLGIIFSLLLLSHNFNCSSQIMQQSLDFISVSNSTLSEESSLKKAFAYNKQPAKNQAIIAAHYLAINPQKKGTGAREALIHKQEQQAINNKAITLLSEKNTGLLNKADLKFIETLLEKKLRILSNNQTDIARNLVLSPDLQLTDKILLSVLDPTKNVQYVTINLQEMYHPKNETLRNIFKIIMLSRSHETKEILAYLSKDEDITLEESLYYEHQYGINGNGPTYDFIHNNKQLSKFCYSNENQPELSVIIDTQDLSILTRNEIKHCNIDAQIPPTETTHNSIAIQGKNLKKIIQFPLRLCNYRMNTLKIEDNVEEIIDDLMSSLHITNFQTPQNLTTVGNNFLMDSHITHLIIPSFIKNRGNNFLHDCNLQTIQINEELFDDLQGEEFFDKDRFPNLQSIKLLRPHNLTSTLVL